MRTLISTSALLLSVLPIAAAVTDAAAAEAPSSIRRTHLAMGTEFAITVYARSADENPNVLAPLIDEVFVEVDLLENLLTTWRSDSQIMNVNRHAYAAPVRVSADVFTLVRAAQEYFEVTGGAFDPTIGPLSRLYGRYDERGRDPSAAEIARALDSIGMRHVQLDAAAQTIAFDRPGMELDFGGIGKGFAADRAAEILRRHGVTRALVDAGTSTIVAMGAPPGERGWTVRIRDPYNSDKALVEFLLADESLSTSGCYGFDEADGGRSCDIFDPRTGRPRSGMLSATVVGPTATGTDALSTGLLVMGVDEARKLCEQRPEIRAMLVPEPPDGDPVPIWIGGGEAPWENGSTR